MTAKISRTNTPSRLYLSDLAHVNGKVKNEGSQDVRFKDRSSAIRHYVRLGVIAEKRTQGANSLSDRIVKDNQREVITETLGPVKKSIDDLITIVERMNEDQGNYFQTAVGQTEALSRRIETGFSTVSNQIETLLKNIFEDIQRTGVLSEATLRNTLVVRSLLYTFTIAYKLEQLKPNPNAPWDKVVSAINRKVTEFSVEEMNSIDPRIGETRAIRELSKTMFLEIKDILTNPTKQVS